MTYYTADNMSMCIATHGQLTAWRNADVKLATGECITPDTFQSAFVTLPTLVTERRGAAGKYVFAREQIGRTIGYYRGTHLLETAQFCWWMLQTTSPTTEGVPASYNTHAITLNESQTPKNLGIHVQSTMTSEDLLWDLLGLLPESLEISCSEKEPVAKQRITIPFSYANTASDDFTKTERNRATTGTIGKQWGHAVTGGLGAAAGDAALTYNSASTECDIVGFTVRLTRKNSFHAVDANYYPTRGVMGELDWEIILDVVPTGSALFAIYNTSKDSYTGDLDLAFSLTADATNDKITFAFDKLYLDAFEKKFTYDPWVEQYQITLSPLGSGSSVTITGIDSLNNDHYENP